MSKNDKVEINDQNSSLGNKNVDNQHNKKIFTKVIKDYIIELQNKTPNHLNKLLMSQKKV